MTQDEFNVLSRDDLEKLKFVLDTNGDVAIRILGVGGGGSSTFVGLTDTPASFTGKAGLFPKVNAGEDALEFVAISGGGDMLASTYDPNTVSGDTFDMDNMVEGATTKIMTATERTKLTGIQAGATVDQDLTPYVDNTSTESIGGVKTFTSSPIVPAPTTDLQVATKKYVDDNGGGGGSGDVTKVGTPLINELGIWTGDGTLGRTTELTATSSGADLLDLNLGGYTKIQSRLNGDSEESCTLESTQSVDMKIGTDGWLNVYGPGDVFSFGGGTSGDFYCTYVIATEKISTDGYLQAGEIATPTTPDSGYGKLYFKADGKAYSLNDSGTEVGLGQNQETPINAQTGTTYTLALTDQSKLVTLTNASAITLTIPTNASVAFPVGTQIDLSQDGAGAITVGGAGVTINSLDGNKTSNGQYVGLTLVKTATDTWNLYGNLTT